MAVPCCRAACLQSRLKDIPRRAVHRDSYSQAFIEVVVLPVRRAICFPIASLGAHSTTVRRLIFIKHDASSMSTADVGNFAVAFVCERRGNLDFRLVCTRRLSVLKLSDFLHTPAISPSPTFPARTTVMFSRSDAHLCPRAGAPTADPLSRAARLRVHSSRRASRHVFNSARVVPRLRNLVCRQTTQDEADVRSYPLD